MLTYGSVTVHFEAEAEEPVTIDRVTDLVNSRFLDSGNRALYVIDDPLKDLSLGLLEVKVLLFRPDEIEHLVLREGKKETTASVEEVIG